jgi:2-hydroxy-3-oxopropionate reductase
MAEIKVGFIGLGIMGAPMAENLVRAGHPLVVHNRTRGKESRLVEMGATAAASPSEVASASDIVITMLPDSPDVETVYFGDDGVIDGAHAGQLLIDMSSVAPATARAVAAAAAVVGASALDAPVSGGDIGARAGTLSIMVGGDEEAFDRALPLLETLGSTVVRMGGAGAGQTAKACNQLLVALIIEAVSEALVLASKAGVDPDRLIEVLSGGLAGNRVMEVRKRNLLDHDFTPGFRVDLHHKDLGIALRLARELDVDAPATLAVERMFAELRASGRGGDDHTALLTLLEARSAHRVGDAPEP